MAAPVPNTGAKEAVGKVARSNAKVLKDAQAALDELNPVTIENAMKLGKSNKLTEGVKKLVQKAIDAGDTETANLFRNMFK